MKKVLLIVVDACASRVLLPAMQAGKLPNFLAMAEAGSLNPESIAIFPSITPAATTSLVTGRYPKQHGILGYHWYDPKNHDVAYYGDDFWVIWREGFGEFLRDFLVKLNNERLIGDTLFQLVERASLKAASLNYLIFKGDEPHTADVPLLANLLPGAPSSARVYGPSILYFGDLVDSEIEVLGDSLDTTGGMFHRFGFDDDNTSHLLTQLARKKAMPNFVLAYFPDNDYRSHEVGPAEAVTALETVDQKLGELFDASGGLERLLESHCLILTGDHSQTDMVEDEEEAGIRLDDLLADFAIAPAGESWGPDDDLVICPDMRTAQIYFKEFSINLLERVIPPLMEDPRIDQVLWPAEHLKRTRKGYSVASRRGRLHFWPGADGPNTAVDRYGCSWSWEGELGAVGGRVSGNTITFPDYPNAFERIVGGLAAENSGDLWLTARPGYEFRLAETGIHVGGGSHGSLHVLDSVSPLLVAGAPEEVELPKYPRAVDVTPLILSILGLESEHSVGESHIEEDRGS